MKQSGSRNIKFKKAGYQKWSYGDWVIRNNGIGYSIENKAKKFDANTDSFINARDFVTCKVLDINWLKIGSKEWLEQKHKLITKGE